MLSGGGGGPDSVYMRHERNHTPCYSESHVSMNLPVRATRKTLISFNQSYVLSAAYTQCCTTLFAEPIVNVLLPGYAENCQLLWPCMLNSTTVDMCVCGGRRTCSSTVGSINLRGLILELLLLLLLWLTAFCLRNV